jgi:hypothetical protein
VERVLHWRLARPRRETPVEVDLDDVLVAKIAPHRTAGIDQESIGPASQTAMAVEVDDLGFLEHPDRSDELLLALIPLHRDLRAS